MTKPRRRRSLGVLGLLAVLGVVVAAARCSFVSPPAVGELIGGEEDGSAWWVLAKHTIALAAGTIESVGNDAREYLCVPKTQCLSDLGCGALRAWCEVLAPYPSTEFNGNAFELHWVEAPRLNDIRYSEDGSVLDAWIRSWRVEDTRSAFAANKVQLYARNVSAYARRGLPVAYERSSFDAEGARVAHVGIDLGSRAYEIVGPAFDEDFPQWSSDECPQPLAAPLSLYERVASEFALPSYFGDARDASPLVFVGASAATSNLELQEPLFDHLERLSAATVTRETRQNDCDVAAIAWQSMPGVAFRYVLNHNAHDLHQLRAFDTFAAREHDAFEDEAWLSWDRLLDQHVGLWYGNADRAACDRRASRARRLLLETRGLAVAERQEPDAHELYVGYNGSMSWEYQFAKCDAGRPDAPSECACSPRNNLDDFLASSSSRATTCLNFTLGDDDSHCQRW